MCVPLATPVRSAAPTFEPVTLDEAKKQVEVPLDDTYHDEHLTELISAAREQVEHDTGIVVATGSFTWKFAEWPSADWLVLPIRPVTAAAISYVDLSGATQSFSGSNFVLASGAVSPAIMLAYGASWPTHRGHYQDITVTLTAGYSSALTVPKLVRQAVLIDVARRFEDRTGAERGEQDLAAYVRAYEMIIRRLSRHSYP